MVMCLACDAQGAAGPQGENKVLSAHKGQSDHKGQQARERSVPGENKVLSAHKGQSDHKGRS